jgi:uncharacterized alpha-E superfamily protein
MAYRTGDAGFDRAAMLRAVLANETDPRSLVFQLSALADHLAALPRPSDALPSSNAGWSIRHAPGRDRARRGSRRHRQGQPAAGRTATAQRPAARPHSPSWTCRFRRFQTF